MPERDLPASYKVERSEEFIRQFSELRKIYLRTNDLINSVDWALSRRPHHFTKVAGDYYLWVTENIDNPEIPKIKIVYRIIDDDNKVILLAIEEDL
jgi:hypothetical protein